MCDIASLLNAECSVPRQPPVPVGLKLLADACLSFSSPPAKPSIKSVGVDATPPSAVSTKLLAKKPDDSKLCTNVPEDVSMCTSEPDDLNNSTRLSEDTESSSDESFKPPIERSKVSKPKKTAIAAGRIFKGPWRPSETALLMRLVRKHGARNWAELAEHIPGRTGKQARERWKNHLDPALKKSAWTPEEDAIIERRYRTEGCRWSRIARSLPGRSDNDVKNRFNSAIRARLHLAPKKPKGRARTGSSAKAPPIYVPPNLRWQLPTSVVEPTMFNFFL